MGKREIYEFRTSRRQRVSLNEIIAFTGNEPLSKNLAQHLNTGTLLAGFNAPAALFGWLWFSSRKLYRYSILLFVLELGWIFSAVLCFKANLILLSQASFIFALCVTLITTRMSMGLMANILLARKALAVITEVSQRQLSAAEHLSEIAHRGGHDEQITDRVTFLLARMTVSLLTGKRS